MEAFSSLLLDLYRQVQITPPTEFQTITLEKVSHVLPFDSAIWATGIMGAEGTVVHAACIYRQPPEMMENYERIKQHDTLGFETFNRLGQTINAALTTDPYWLSRLHPDVLTHINRFGMAHVLTTHIAEPVLRLFTGIAFYRADPQQPYNEDERLLQQNLSPHLVEACNVNRFNFTNVQNKEGLLPNHGRAICDTKGVLHNANHEFEMIMLAEWPDWHGPSLPPTLLDLLSDDTKQHFTGHHIVATIKALNDMHWVCIRKKTSIDVLSARELEVATRAGRGMNHREIGEALHIAPVTVRNHLQSIYAKLGVNNKVGMARMIFDSEE